MLTLVMNQPRQKVFKHQNMPDTFAAIA